MPARIDHPAVREQVRLLYIANGKNLTQAATAIGIPVDRAEKWKERGKWDKDQSQITKQANVSEAVGSHREYAEKALANRKASTRLNLSKYLINASKVASRSRSPLADAPKVRDVASVMEKVWPEEKQGENQYNLQMICSQAVVQVGP